MTTTRADTPSAISAPAALGSARTLAVLWVLASMVLGAGLRCYKLGAQPLWTDEAATVYFAQHSVSYLWFHNALETNPPLYYTIQHFWLVFGESEAAIRSLPVVLGIATIPLLYMLVRTLAGQWPGLMAATLLAVCQRHIHYSREARTYVLVVLLATIAMWALAVFLCDPARASAALPRLGRRGANPNDSPGSARPMWAAWLAYTLSVIAALYSHNTAVLLPFILTIAAVIGYFAIPGFQRGFAWNWLACNLFVLLVWAFWIPVVMHQSQGTLKDFWIPAPTPTYIGKQLQLAYAQPYVFALQPWVNLGLVVAAVAGVVFARRNTAALIVLLLAALGPPLAAIAISFKTPIFNERVIVWALVGWLALIAMGLWALRWKPLVVLTFLVVVAIFLKGAVNYHQMFKKEAWRQVASIVKSDLRKGDAIVFVPGASELGYSYYQKNGPVPRINVEPAGAGTAWYTPIAPVVTPEQLPAATRGFERLWIIRRRPGGRLGLTLPEEVMHALAQDWDVASYKHITSLHLYLMVRPPAGSERPHASPPASQPSPEPESDDNPG